MDFQEFRGKYPARAPRAHVIKNADEMKLLSVGDGLRFFDESSGLSATHSPVPRSAQDRGCLYLWTVTENAVPHALEDIAFGRSLETGCIKHTNLTGGLPAHCGGELWFVADNSILVGGSSGRYGPNSIAELDDVALAFKEVGYRVASLGFDDDTGYCAKVLVGDPKWL